MTPVKLTHFSVKFQRHSANIRFKKMQHLLSFLKFRYIYYFSEKCVNFCKKKRGAKVLKIRYTRSGAKEKL